MPTLPFFLVDAFTTKAFEGNPAGVFLDETATLTDDDRMAYCAEVSLESAFVSFGGDGAMSVRYATGACPVPFCGHATVSALTVLSKLGRIPKTGRVEFDTEPGPMSADLFENADGSVSVTLRQFEAELSEPLSDEIIDALLRALGLTRGDLSRGLLAPRVVSTGTPWILAHALDPKFVDNAAPDFAAIEQVSWATNSFGLYLFASQTVGSGYVSRCFAPRAGLPEDPVTGSANGCLAGYLAASGQLRPGELRAVRQGFGGGRGGVAVIGIDGDGTPLVTGTAVILAGSV